MKQFFIKLGRWIKAKYISSIMFVSMRIRFSKECLRHGIAWNMTDGAKIVEEVLTERYIDKIVDEYSEWILQKSGWTEEEWERAMRWS